MELGKLAVWASVEGQELGPAIETAQRIESLGYSALGIRWRCGAISS
ncbi:MAG: hypothetical protein R3F21_22840 [Myxococcota bacterium]